MRRPECLCTIAVSCYVRPVPTRVSGFNFYVCNLYVLQRSLRNITGQVWLRMFAWVFPISSSTGRCGTFTPRSNSIFHTCCRMTLSNLECRQVIPNEDRSIIPPSKHYFWGENEGDLLFSYLNSARTMLFRNVVAAN